MTSAKDTPTKTNNYQQLTVPANHVIFEENVAGDCAYLLKKGQVEISKNINGVKKVITVLNAPIMFGEMAVIMPDQKRTARALALSECELVTITQSVFKQFIDSSPQMMKSTMELIVQRLKTCTEKALHVPNTDLSIIHNLYLLSSHHVSSIDYNLFLQEMSNILLQPQSRIEKTLQKLINADLMSKRKGQFSAAELVFHEKEDFMGKARQALAKAS